VSLCEALLALALAAGPLLVALGLIQSNVRGARQVTDACTARLVLVDVSEVLLQQPIDQLRGDLGASGGPVRIEELLGARTDEMSAGVRLTYSRQLGAVATSITATYEDDAGGQAGLGRLVVRLASPGGPTLRVVRYFRPHERKDTGADGD
jgi:hypothetical protein